MDIEVWERAVDPQTTDNLIGIAKLPLHHFHIAFNDVNVRRHVEKQKVCAARPRLPFVR